MPDYHVHLRRFGTDRLGGVAIDIPAQPTPEAAARVAEAVLTSWPAAHNWEISAVCHAENTRCARINA